MEAAPHPDRLPAKGGERVDHHRLLRIGMFMSSIFNSRTSSGTAQAFNPQPDPPGKVAAAQQQRVNPGEIHGFNPQPDPPGLPVAAVH